MLVRNRDKRGWSQRRGPGIPAPETGQVFEGPASPHHTWECYQQKPFAAWKMLYHWTLRRFQKTSISVLLSNQPEDLDEPLWAVGRPWGINVPNLPRAEETLCLVD